jgi:putative glutamine amidotransferase
MKRIAISQRVEVVADYGERRDALDQRWTGLFEAAGLVLVPIPNTVVDHQGWLAELAIDGVLLSGGNDLAVYGGDAPERDRLEVGLIEWSIAVDRPLLGVCRGMQVIQHHFGVGLHPVEGHVTSAHDIDLDGASLSVNSYHRWGATDTVPDLLVTGRAADGVIEAVEHRDYRVRGIMWHPERCETLHRRDIALLRTTFGVEA